MRAPASFSGRSSTGGSTGARIDHRRDRDAGADEVARRPPAAVVVGEHGDIAAGGHGVAVGVGPHRSAPA